MKATRLVLLNRFVSLKAERKLSIQAALLTGVFTPLEGIRCQKKPCRFSKGNRQQKKCFDSAEVKRQVNRQQLPIMIRHKGKYKLKGK